MDINEKIKNLEKETKKMAERLDVIEKLLKEVTEYINEKEDEEWDADHQGRFWT